ncbi:MAG: hydantoinase/oxoprolinase family protein, partial [Acidobacteria bacterium]|nr:hydantoinase/oxoprolinase family protein [Acidobacteriota bacterium]
PIASVEEFAAGIVRLAETEMERAIRLISVERGHDPREFVLVSFGGAGPLHACSLARALAIPRVMIPAMPGALSALGILLSDIVRDYSRTVMISVGNGPAQSTGGEGLDYSLEPHFAELERTAKADFERDGLSGNVTRSLDLRYAGQGYELNIPAGPEMLESFHRAHGQRYGHRDEHRKVEVVNVRVRMTALAEPPQFLQRPATEHDLLEALIKRKRVMFGGQWFETGVFDRERLQSGDRFEGPAIVHEYSATTVIPPGSKVEVDDYSNLLIAV